MFRVEHVRMNDVLLDETTRFTILIVFSQYGSSSGKHSSLLTPVG